MLVVVSMLVASGLTLLAGTPALRREGVDNGKLVLLLIVAAAVTVVVELLALRARASLAERERFAWNKLRPMVAMACVIAFALFPPFVVSAGTFHLLEAKVCVEHQLDTSGVLVRETSAGVYIGDPRGTGEGHGESSPSPTNAWRSS